MSVGTATFGIGLTTTVSSASATGEAGTTGLLLEGRTTTENAGADTFEGGVATSVSSSPRSVEDEGDGIAASNEGGVYEGVAEISPAALTLGVATRVSSCGAVRGEDDQASCVGCGRGGVGSTG